MNKFEKRKLSKQNLHEVVKKCLTQEDDDIYIEMPIRDEENPEDVIVAKASLNKIREHSDEIKYMLGQLHIFHTENNSMQYGHLALLYKDGKKVSEWTKDPISLIQISRLGYILGAMDVFKKVQIPLKDGSTREISATKLPPVGDKRRITPTFYKEGPSLDD